MAVQCDGCKHIMTDKEYENCVLCPMCHGAYCTTVADQKCNCEVCADILAEKDAGEHEKSLGLGPTDLHAAAQSCRDSRTRLFLQQLLEDRNTIGYLCEVKVSGADDALGILRDLFEVLSKKVGKPGLDSIVVL